MKNLILGILLISTTSAFATDEAELRIIEKCNDAYSSSRDVAICIQSSSQDEVEEHKSERRTMTVTMQGSSYQTAGTHFACIGTRGSTKRDAYARAKDKCADRNGRVGFFGKSSNVDCDFWGGCECSATATIQCKISY